MSNSTQQAAVIVHYPKTIDGHMSVAEFENQQRSKPAPAPQPFIPATPLPVVYASEFDRLKAEAAAKKIAEAKDAFAVEIRKPLSHENMARLEDQIRIIKPEEKDIGGYIERCQQAIRHVARMTSEIQPVTDKQRREYEAQCKQLDAEGWQRAVDAANARLAEWQDRGLPIENLQNELGGYFKGWEAPNAKAFYWSVIQAAEISITAKKQLTNPADVEQNNEQLRQSIYSVYRNDRLVWPVNLKELLAAADVERPALVA